MGNGSGLPQATQRFVWFAGVWWSVDRTGVGVAMGGIWGSGLGRVHIRYAQACAAPHPNGLARQTRSSVTEL
jgi:hypothetical protein